MHYPNAFTTFLYKVIRLPFSNFNRKQTLFNVHS